MPEDTFVEKLATALRDATVKCNDPRGLTHEQCALVLLRAAREPSEGMFNAGFEPLNRGDEDAYVIWQAMIDHALAEHEKQSEDAA